MKLRQRPFVEDDITEIKVAEKALMERNNSLNESEAKFRNLVETSPDIIWEIDSQGEFIYISPNCLKITGYQPEEIIGKSIYFLIKPEYIPKIEKIFLSHLKEKKHSFVFEIPLLMLQFKEEERYNRRHKSSISSFLAKVSIHSVGIWL